MPDVVRVAALTGYAEAMAALGVDTTPLLREQGLTADLLAHRENLIPAIATMRLLERSAEVTGCITLGLKMAEGRSLANLGAASLLITHLPNLREMLEALREFHSRINSTLAFHFEEGPEDAILREDFSLSRPEHSRQSIELVLGVLARICSASADANWTPRTVCFSHKAPPTAELPIYSRVFRCRPEFNCEFDGIVIAKSDLDRPNAAADEQLAQHARQLLETVQSPTSRTAAQDVEQLIKLLLPSGRATIHICATSLGVTVRTLQRMLDAEGESFSHLLNRARMQMATQYLSNSRMRITDVADLLGYNSIGNFSRWFSQAFEQSPREWRARHL